MSILTDRWVAWICYFLYLCEISIFRTNVHSEFRCCNEFSNTNNVRIILHSKKSGQFMADRDIKPTRKVATTAHEKLRLMIQIPYCWLQTSSLARCIGKFWTIDIYVCAYNYLYAVSINIHRKDIGQGSKWQTDRVYSAPVITPTPLSQLMRHIMAQSVSPKH